MKSRQEQIEELEFEMAAYAARQEELEATLWGKWVVFHGGELRGAYDDFQAAANAAVTQFGRGPYHIRQVGASQDVHIPTPLGSSIHRPTASCELHQP